MNKAEAKREAYRRAASCLSSATDTGWPIWDDNRYAYATNQDGARVADALNEIIAELDRRATMGRRRRADTGTRRRSGD